VLHLVVLPVLADPLHELVFAIEKRLHVRINIHLLFVFVCLFVCWLVQQCTDSESTMAIIKQRAIELK
jgi:hypothetical protein